MLKQRVFIGLLFLIITSVVNAQGKFKFEKVVHDFGVISEGTQAEFNFTFTNSGDQPIVLSSVKASCGCTTPFYTKESIMPGETGTIKVNYNSKGRLGIFNKSITIHANTEEMPVVYIKGIVEVSSEMKEYSATELANSPIISVDREVIQMGILEKGKETQASILISNKGKSDLVIEKIISACMCVNVKDVNRTLKAGESSVFMFTYIPSNLGDIEEVLTIFSNDLKTKYKMVTLLSNSKTTLGSENMLKTNTSSGF